MKQINKIFVNTLPTTNTSGGMLTFLLELLHAFGKINNPKLNYCLICSEKNESLFRSFENYNNFSRIVVKVDNRNAIKRILYEQFMLPKILNAEKNAALLNICNVANFRCKIPQMTIIQVQLGIAKLRRSLPKKFVFISPLHKIYYDLFLERSLKRSTRTIAISNFMVKFLEEYKDKITVIHEGVNLDNFKTTAGSVDLNAPSYILSLSTLFPHKNMDRVIEAFNLFIKRTKANFNLMIVGKDPDGKQIPQLKELAKSLGIENRVIFKGRVPAEDIPSTLC
jgi:glycosyltransferase involved in cell wall biosynthesis